MPPGGAARANLSALALAVMELLEGERDYPAMSAAKLAECLRVTGRCPEGRPATVQEIESAAGELLAAGKVERIWRRGVACYRALDSRQVGEPGG